MTIVTRPYDPTREQIRDGNVVQGIVLHEINESLASIDGRMQSELAVAHQGAQHQGFHFAVDASLSHAYMPISEATFAISDLDTMSPWTIAAANPGIDADLYTINVAVSIGIGPLPDPCDPDCAECGRTYPTQLLRNLQELLAYIADAASLDLEDAEIVWPHGTELCDLDIEPLLEPIVAPEAFLQNGGTVQGTYGTWDIRATDEGAVAGNARGENSVDLQTTREVATQVASGVQSVIGGGEGNTASGIYSTGGGGYGNFATGEYSAILGGQSNTASGYLSTVVAGQGNTASGYLSTVVAGQSNTASGDHSAILGGISNDTNSIADAMIVGSNITASLANATHMNQLVITQIPTASAGLPSGAVWSNAGILTIVP